MSKVKKLVLALLVVVGMSGQGVAQDVKVGVTVDSRPFSYVDEKGNHIGFNVDMAREICARLNVTCTFVFEEYSHLLPKVHAGELDFALPNMLKTPEREKLAGFTKAYWRSTSSYVGPVDLSFGNVDKVLLREKICAIEKTKQIAYLRQKMGGAVHQLVVNTTTKENLESMVAGKCRILLMPTMQSLSFLQSDEGRGFGYLGEPIFGKGLGGDVHMIVRPDRPDLLKVIDVALESMIADGTHMAITKKYFPFKML
ncbi:substrate-binding periplasmic protein [Terasakiella pusilla]|uniref:substrate-binding periplasmic protein n=1 Tax=Terasakiella pusilla TaxID=64973 RepID=UPI003AA94D96